MSVAAETVKHDQVWEGGMSEEITRVSFEGAVP